MSKAELISQLQNAKNNCILSLAAVSLFADEMSFTRLRGKTGELGNYHVSFDQVASLLEQKTDREIALKEFAKMSLRALIKESFELLRDYCKSSGQNNSLKTQSWYQFARLIRNCLSHNFKFEFNGYDRNLLPVTWDQRSITISMEGTYLDLVFFGYDKAWELFQEMRAFTNVLS